MAIESYARAVQHILAEITAAVGLEGATVREILLVAAYLDYLAEQGAPADPPVNVEREAMEARAMADGLA